MRALLAPVVAQGHNRKAVMLLNDLKQMFKWADGRRPWKTLVDNPTANLRPDEVTEPGYTATERDRFLTEEEIRQLADLLPKAGLEPKTKVAIWLTLSCCTRIGETIKAKWADINLDAGTWFIPEANTKGKSPAHTVYLSPFARQQFTLLKGLTGHGNWCFPNSDSTNHADPKSPTKQIGDRQLSTKDRSPLKNRTKLADSLLLPGGAWTFHDLRRTGATLMQKLGVAQHIIERVLNHAEQNRMLRIYQQHDFSDEQRQAWSKLGSLLTELSSYAPNLYPIR